MNSPRINGSSPEKQMNAGRGQAVFGQLTDKEKCITLYFAAFLLSMATFLALPTNRRERMILMLLKFSFAI
jgi:hypothetical protein